MDTNKILIGGQALRNLGHNRHTDDVDYLVFDKNLPLFSKLDENTDLINGAKNSFLNAIFEKDFKLKIEKSIEMLKNILKQK